MKQSISPSSSSSLTHQRKQTEFDFVFELCDLHSFFSRDENKTLKSTSFWFQSFSGELDSMAYVDHAFSISDEDLMIGTSYTVSNRPPVKEISLAVALLVFGTLGIVSGFFMAYNRVGGDRGHGIFFIVLGCLLFIPGFYYTRIAYYAYKGYKGFSFSNIPSV